MKSHVVCPAMSCHCPTAQASQAVARPVAALDVPAAHARHEDWAAVAWYWPAGQALQLVWETVFWYVPPAQLEQSEAAGKRRETNTTAHAIKASKAVSRQQRNEGRGLVLLQGRDD